MFLGNAYKILFFIIIFILSLFIQGLVLYIFHFILYQVRAPHRNLATHVL